MPLPINVTDYYVIATSALLRPEDVPEAYRELATSEINQWIGAKKGGCRIYAPGENVIAQAAVGEETILATPDDSQISGNNEHQEETKDTENQ